MVIARPYVAAFSARFLLMLQYRAAALAGFATQCWWGAIKVMVYAAFYHASPAARAAPMSLAQVITYTWLNQAFLALGAWGSDPEAGLLMRSGAVGLDRLRPVDTYALWFARSAGWMTSRALPRAGLMFLTAGVALPLLRLDAWAWHLPANVAQTLLFALSMLFVVALATSLTMFLNIAVVVTLNDRGINSLASPFTIVLSGSLLPLPLYPGCMHAFLFIQPFAGLVDIPFRIYAGNLHGEMAWAGIGLQVLWTAVFVVVGRAWMERVMRRLQVQGG